MLGPAPDSTPEVLTDAPPAGRHRVGGGPLVAATVALVAAVAAGVWLWSAHSGPAAPAPVLTVVGHGVMPTPDQWEQRDIDRFADAEDITREEATARYAWQLDFGRVAGRVSDAYSDIYSSARMNPPGWVGGVFLFTERPPRSALDLIATLPVSSRVVVDAPYTSGQIETVSRIGTDGAAQALGDRPGGWSTGYDDDAQAFVVEARTGPDLTEADVAREITDYLDDHLEGLATPVVRVRLVDGLSVEAD